MTEVDLAPNLYAAHPAEILRRFVQRLRNSLNVSYDVCFQVDDPHATPPSTMPDRAYLVSYEGASLNGDVDQVPEYLVETAYINVTCFNRVSAIDESSRANSFTTRHDVNLFEMKRRVMLALVNWRLELPGERDIEIASTVKATRSSKPEILQADSGSFGAFLTLTFSVAYAIDLCDQDYNAQ